MFTFTKYSNSVKINTYIVFVVRQKLIILIYCESTKLITVVLGVN